MCSVLHLLRVLDRLSILMGDEVDGQDGIMTVASMCLVFKLAAYLCLGARAQVLVVRRAVSCVVVATALMGLKSIPWVGRLGVLPLACPLTAFSCQIGL